MRDVMIVPREMDGCRLDRALAVLWPHSSLRRRRRAFEAGEVQVDGVGRRPGFRVRAGQEVVVLTPAPCAALAPCDVSVLADDGTFAALAKPAGAHSAWVAGSPEPGVEGLLGGMFPGRGPLLANRLDRSTSGVLLVAFGEEALSAYRAWESGGRVEKRYLAWVRGRVADALRLDRELDTAGGPRVRVLSRPAADPLRVTLATPLRQAGPWTLVRAVIRKGARHQIRAHLAAAGHPIMGDELYGEPAQGGLRLHHVRLILPGFEAACDPSWGGW